MGSGRFARILPRGALILIVLFTLVIPSTGQEDLRPVDDPGPGQVLNTGVHPFTRDAPTIVENKTPLLEVFTATWCPPCRPAHGAVERLMDEHSPGLAKNTTDEPVDLALLSYHPFPDVGGEDPFGIPEGHNRLEKKYDAFWFPSAYIDGALEDAPATRTTAVDVGLEESLYNSYRNLISKTWENEPPFVLTIDPVLTGDDPSTWEVAVTLEATRTIDTPLLVQGVLWEDHVSYLGSNEVDQHRMVVRSMAPPAETPQVLEAGDTWEGRLTLVAPSEMGFEHAGVSVIVEAPWGEERDERATWFFSLALFVAGGTVAGAVWQIRATDRHRRTRRHAHTPKEEPAPDSDEPHGEPKSDPSPGPGRDP